jgi:hypothetical protein
MARSNDRLARAKWSAELAFPCLQALAVKNELMFHKNIEHLFPLEYIAP